MEDFKFGRGSSGRPAVTISSRPGEATHLLLEDRPPAEPSSITAGHGGSTPPATAVPPSWTPEHEARCVRIYGLLRAGLITPFEADQAISDIERDGGLR